MSTEQGLPGVLYQRRTAFPGAWYAGAAAVLAFGLMLFTGSGRSVASEIPWAFAVAAGVVALYAGLWQTPIVGEGKRIRVDATGLYAARKHLPAANIGSIEVVTEEELLGAAWGNAVGERRVSRTHQFTSGTKKPGVLIRDLGRDRRPYWLIESPEPAELATALQLAKQGTQA